MPKKPLLLMQTGDAPDFFIKRHDNLDKIFMRMADLSSLGVQVTRVFDDEPLAPPSDYSGVIITGSPAMVTDKSPWIKTCSAWIKKAISENIPLLGICFGHQLVAKALGGKVAALPEGIEVGTQKITMAKDIAPNALLEYLPTSFLANVSHKQHVVKAPSQAKVVASSAKDPHQILVYGPQAITVQFHPEFNGDVIETCIELAFSDEDLSPALQKKKTKLLKGAEDTPVAASVLKLFVHLLSTEELA